MADRRASEDFTLAAGDDYRPTAMWYGRDHACGWRMRGDFNSAVGNIFAYDMATKHMDTANDFNTLTAAGNLTAPPESGPTATIMWVA